MAQPTSAYERLDDLAAALKGLAEICMHTDLQRVDGVQLHGLLRILGEEAARVSDELEAEAATCPH